SVRPSSMRLGYTMTRAASNMIAGHPDAHRPNAAVPWVALRAVAACSPPDALAARGPPAITASAAPLVRVHRAGRMPSAFSAARWIGLPIDSTCGGRGTCGKCKVQVLQGGAEITTADRKQLRADELEAGWRLSCQAKVYDDTTVTVPELMRVPKAATMGVNRLVLLDPNVRKVFVELSEPTLEDQRSDVERLRDALTAEGFDMKVDLQA